MAKKAKAALRGVLSRVVAKAFGVHRRTVFRWTSKGLLRSDKDGHVDPRDFAQNLRSWRASYSGSEARKKLKISPNSMAAWRKKKLLEMVVICGLERYTKKSVDALVDRPVRRIFLVKRGYSRRNRVLTSLGIGSAELKKLLENGDIPSQTVRGEVVIPTQALEEIEAAWRASAYVRAARRIVHASSKRFARMIETGEVREICVIGHRRILLDGLAKTKGDHVRLDAYLKDEAVKLARRRRMRIVGGRKIERFAHRRASARAGWKTRRRKVRMAERARLKAEARAVREAERAAKRALKEKLRAKEARRKAVLKARRMQRRAEAREAKKAERAELKAQAKAALDLARTEERARKEKAREEAREAMKKQQEETLAAQRLLKQQAKARERFRAPRIAKVNGHARPEPPPPPLPDHKLEPVVVRGFETRRLTTCEEVAKAARKSAEFVRSQYVAGSLRGIQPKEGEIYIYLASAEVFLQRLRANGR